MKIEVWNRKLKSKYFIINGLNWFIMTILQIPPELKVEKSNLDTTRREVVNEMLANYLWKEWLSYFLEIGVLDNHLWNLICNKFSEEVLRWFSGQMSWETLVQKIISVVESDNIEYKFVFELFPKAIFGLPDGDKLVIPTKTKIVGVLEPYSGKSTKHGTLPQYRKEDEKVLVNHELGKLKINFEDDMVTVVTVSRSLEDAKNSAIDFVDKFTHSWTVLSPVPISFKLVSGWDQYGRSIPKTFRWGIEFFSYDLDDTKKQIDKSMEIVPIWDQKLKQSLEYFDHAQSLDQIRMKIFKEQDEGHRMLLSDIILSLYKSVTVIIGDPALKKDRDYQRRYKEYGIDYDFWKNKIDKLREIRNNWGVAHYYISEEKFKRLNRVLKESFQTTKQTILKYVEFLENSKRS